MLMREFLSRSTMMSVAALAISIATAAAVVLERVSEWSLITSEGEETASPPSPFGEALPARVLFPQLEKPDDQHNNYMISLTYNWDWDADGGWSRPDATNPSVALTLESWFYGLAELNFDMRPPEGDGAWPGGRLMGFAARYDGTYATLSLGGKMFNPEGAGIKLTGGLSPEPLVALKEGRVPTSSILEVARADGTSSFAIKGGATPTLAFGLSGSSVSEIGEGVLRFVGPLGSEPAINLIGSGPDATLLASHPAARNAPRFQVAADGTLTWTREGEEETTSLAAEEGGIAVSGGIAASKLRIGRSGTAIQELRVIPAELHPAPVRGYGVVEQTFEIQGINAGATIVINGPAQPDGLGIGSARTIGKDLIGVTFVNALQEPQRPALGRYIVLSVEVQE